MRGPSLGVAPAFEPGGGDCYLSFPAKIVEIYLRLVCMNELVVLSHFLFVNETLEWNYLGVFSGLDLWGFCQVSRTPRDKYLRHGHRPARNVKQRQPERESDYTDFRSAGRNDPLCQTMSVKGERFLRGTRLNLLNVGRSKRRADANGKTNNMRNSQI